jgi:acetolactate synthase I/II/III large subunit
MGQTHTDSVATAYLAMLVDRGVDHLFGNAGTDFAPLLEAYAQAMQGGRPVPRPILATHENLAVTMAHGYAMVSHRIPAVMVHVSVGTANMLCGAMNAARENVALLLTAGRSPITETGLPGARDGYIHWAQEMYDQAGIVREFVKWDYELRNGQQLATVVDRALAIAGSEPCGPVYLTLPREVLAAPMPDASRLTPRRVQAVAPAGPNNAAIGVAADMLAEAERPLIVTSNAGRDPAAFARLAEFAGRCAIPVVQHKPRYLSIPSSHPMNLGYDPHRLIGEADVIIALETDVPWIPTHAEPAPDCRIIQAGFDPLFTHIPIRGFPSDVGLTGAPATIIEALTEAVATRSAEAVIGRRRAWVEERRAALHAEWDAARQAAASRTPIDLTWISHCLDGAKPPQTVVINEYSLALEHCKFEEAEGFFGASSASGLGWGAGAALGAKLAAPDRPVVAVLGDGAFLFSNPVAVHHAARLHGLPVLFIIVNNAMWNAVRQSTLAMYPHGRAAKSNDAPFMRLEDLPPFEQICAAGGGHGERVEDPAALPEAMKRALSVVTKERRHALLNVICQAAP